MHKICRDFTDSKGTSEEGLGVKPNGTIKGGGGNGVFRLIIVQRYFSKF